MSLILCGCRTTPTSIVYQVQELGVIKDVLPRVVQPDLGKWRQLKAGMTEDEVAALLGPPYRKNPRPPDDATPDMISLYGWYYGEISFKSFTTQGDFHYSVTFHEGRVREINDPWNGQFSADGRPTAPELIMPEAGKRLDHYPRFLDFRWQPSSGVYPIEYEIAVQTLSVDQQAAEHFEDYIRKTVDANRESGRAEGLSQKKLDETAAWFAEHLRREQGVIKTFLFHTHDLYLPFTWVGANTGRWRVRGMNDRGNSEWTAWRYFEFSK